ncbi:MAG: SDR family oxidoreductase [Desulfosudaceae bacterium]
MSKLKGQLVFITGGSSGIGLETASLLAAAGCRLVLFARNRDKLTEACRRIRENRAGRSVPEEVSVGAISMDVADNNNVRQQIDTAVDSYGIPDILINSAGIGTADYFENITWEQFDRVMKINVYGTRNTISAALPHMKQKGRGHIVNLSSAAGLLGMFGYTLYSTSKYALVGLSECLRSELKLFNIRVTVVCPPEVKTPFIDDESQTIPPEARAIKQLAGQLQPGYTARTIVRGIKKNRFLVIPGLRARFLYFSHRLSNGFLTRMPSDLIVRWVARKQPRR